jgi:hypothetical protein
MNDHPPIKTDSGYTPRLGSDIGRVIIDGLHHPAGEDTGFFRGDEAALLATPEVTGAVDAISRLVLLFGRENMWLVSKCGQRIQDRTLFWLGKHDFWARTGVDPARVKFVRSRPDKKNVCAYLGIGYFVDDRPDVLIGMHDVVGHRYLFGPQQRVITHDGIVLVPDWATAEGEIRKDFPS